ELAQKEGEKELAKSLLRTWIDRDDDTPIADHVWALEELAKLVSEDGDVREAATLKRQAAGIAEPDDSRRLWFDVAELAKGPRGDVALAVDVYEEIRQREPGDKDAWGPLLDLHRRRGDVEKLAALIDDVANYVDDPHERSLLRFERVRLGMEK